MTDLQDMIILRLKELIRSNEAMAERYREIAQYADGQAYYEDIRMADSYTAEAVMFRQQLEAIYARQAAIHSDSHDISQA